MSKRIIDIAAALFALALMWPLIVAGAIAIKVSSKGPVFYKAKRAGLEGKPFSMYKLRTMRVGTDYANRRVTAHSDDRITAVGALLRRFKIDEMPQFWNVVRGDMSIVGPRPEDWDIVERHYTAEQRRSLEIRPGVTSAAEIRWYPDLAYHDPPPTGVHIQEWYLRRHLPVRLTEELQYMDNQNMLLDLKLVGQTIYRVLVNSWLPPRKQPISSEY